MNFKIFENEILELRTKHIQLHLENVFDKDIEIMDLTRLESKYNLVNYKIDIEKLKIKNNNKISRMIWLLDELQVLYDNQTKFIMSETDFCKK
jgi:predicted ATPase